ncbi:hypothetical protein HK101_008728 [Irineochytrium annulatum]|nr:hypothetical protein HK101_008728 [Irineochytrium annulatum]
MRKGRNGNRLCPILALSELPDEALAAASLRALELDRDTTKYQCLHFFQCSMNALINGRTKVVTALLNRGRPFDEACPAPSEFVNLEPIVRCSPRDPYERCEELLYNWRLQPGAADLSSSIHEAVRHENWRLARLLIGYGHASTKLGPGEFSGFGQEAIAVSG